MCVGVLCVVRLTLCALRYIRGPNGAFRALLPPRDEDDSESDTTSERVLAKHTAEESHLQRSRESYCLSLPIPPYSEARRDKEREELMASFTEALKNRSISALQRKELLCKQGIAKNALVSLTSLVVRKLL